jgi:hypothetical protein
MGFPFPSSGYDLKDTRTYHCTGCGNANTNPVDFTYTYDLKANTSQPSITVTTNTAGRRITVDGASLLSPQTFNWDPGSMHTIARLLRRAPCAHRWDWRQLERRIWWSLPWPQVAIHPRWE